MLTQASTLIDEKRIQEAVELLFKILQCNPRFSKAHSYLGWIYDIYYQNYTSAEKYYKNSIKYDPNYHATYAHYARLLSTCKRFEELKVLLDKALTIPTVSHETIYSEYALMCEKP
jgi:tetratricopeptide (TPR) repeat protein